DDLVAQVVKAVGERLADARSAAGDEDGVASEFHGAFSKFAVEADPFIPLLTVRKKAPKRFILTVWRVTMGVPPPKPWPDSGPRVEELVNDVIRQVADKWTMLILEVLADHGELRFTQVGRHVPGISQKMLTQTLRQMERDGLVQRTVHPVIPPRVEYKLTDLGYGLGEAFCGVWTWAEDNLARIEAARERFDAAKAG